MTFMFRIFLTGFLFAAMLLNATAQDKSFFRHFPYFQDSTITALLQDASGERWAGTTGGVYRFNNINTKAFHHKTNDTLSLSSNECSVLFLDAAGTVWAGTRNGLNRFNSRRRNWTRYMSDPNDKHSLSDNNITAIHQDKQGVIWVGTTNGLNAFYLESNRFDRYSVKTSNLPDNHITAIQIDKKGKLWVGTKNGGIATFDSETQAFFVPKSSNNLPSKEVTTLCADNSGQLWVGTTEGIAIIPSNASTPFEWKYIQTSPSDTNTINDNHVTKIVQGDFRSIWIGTKNGGLNKIELDTRLNSDSYQFYHFMQDSTRPNSLTQNEILAIYKDMGASIYIGTRSGLNKRDASWEGMKYATRNVFGVIEGIFDPSNPTDTSATDTTTTTAKIENGTNVSGYLMYSKLHPAGGVRVKLVNGDGTSVASGMTNSDGSFVFHDLPTDQPFTIQVDTAQVALSEQAIVYLTNDNDDIVMKMKGGETASFEFKTLERDKVNEMELIEGEEDRLIAISLYGQVYKELPGDIPAGMEVWILNEDGEILYATVTDENGKFIFTELPPDQAYNFTIKGLEDEDIIINIMTKDDLVVQKLFKNASGTFTYERLKHDEMTMTLLDEEDIELTIRPADVFRANRIYYDYNSAEINTVAAQELNQLAKILKLNKHLTVELTSHTDARGSEEYNLKLSQKRVDAAVNYLVAQGVSRSSVRGTGHGESKPLNNCTAASDCSENEHGKNRRTEFKFIEKH